VLPLFGEHTSSGEADEHLFLTIATNYNHWKRRYDYYPVKNIAKGGNLFTELPAYQRL